MAFATVFAAEGVCFLAAAAIALRFDRGAAVRAPARAVLLNSRT
jgi:hypothetical protein